jgi:uncharacterized protein YacL
VIKSVLRTAVELIVAVAVGLVALGEARASAPSSAAPVYTMTPERMTASTAVLLALIGAIIGGLALVRSARRIGNRGRRGAIVAIVLGPIGLIIGALVALDAG